MFEELTNRFESIFKKLKGRGKLSEENIAEAMRDVKRALLEADVNYKVVKNFTANVKDKALGSEVLQSVTPGQQFVKIVHEELAVLMGGTAETFRFHTNRLNTIVLAGLQGSEKLQHVPSWLSIFASRGIGRLWLPAIPIAPQQ